ncbi:N-acetylmuramoyl-L-alanine amidase [Candidatus Falkowbacteria bacterium]|nr:N-acetylmuramoyl-L-alanine amidase [Candidatus Falkowbacteria bacterium]
MKFTLKSKFVLILVIFCSITLTFVLVNAESTSNIKEGHIFIDNPNKNGSFFIATNTSHNETISPIMRADFPFNALFATWQVKDIDRVPDVAVRFLNESWSEWIKVELNDDANGKDGGIITESQMLSTKLTDTFQYRISFANDIDKNNLEKLEFAYLDTTKGPSNNFRASLEQNNFQIIARKNWGAEESYRYDALGLPLWQEEYYTPKRFVIHHTAGENPDTNIESAIRAIFYWHSKIKGWGDIGYNYIIDSKGNIYEGRFGGDGVVGGHAYMNNRNSIGIAILGCYETKNDAKNSSCNTPDHLTEAAKIALNKLIAEKSREFNIDPMGQSEYQGRMMPNILGHRDLSQTNCPGTIIYNMLPQIRQLSYNLLQELGGYKKILPTAAEFVRQSTTEINIEETKTAVATAEFKNTGEETWRGYEDNYLYVTDEIIKNKLSKIDSLKIALESDGKDNLATDNLMIYKLVGGNVYPGQIGQFKLALNPPPSTAKETKKFILAWSDKGYFPNTEFSIAINKIPCTSCNQVEENTKHAPAELFDLIFSEKVGISESQKVKIQFKNTSGYAWMPEKLKLKVINAENEITIFEAKDTIKPDGSVAFEFNLKARKNIGAYDYSFSLIYNEQELHKFNKTIQVISPYLAEIKENTIPESMVRNTRKTVTLTFENTGTKTWKLPTIRSYDIDGTNSWFKDWTWLNNKTVKQYKKEVKPGEKITFTFKLQAYWKANTYPQVFKLYDGKTQIYLGSTGNLTLNTEVTKK